MLKNNKWKLALLAGCLFQFGGVIGTCNAILDIVTDPIVFLAALDQLGFIAIGA